MAALKEYHFIEVLDLDASPTTTMLPPVLPRILLQEVTSDRWTRLAQRWLADPLRLLKHQPEEESHLCWSSSERQNCAVCKNGFPCLRESWLSRRAASLAFGLRTFRSLSFFVKVCLPGYCAHKIIHMFRLQEPMQRHQLSTDPLAYVLVSCCRKGCRAMFLSKQQEDVFVRSLKSVSCNDVLPAGGWRVRRAGIGQTCAYLRAEHLCC